MAAKTYFTYLFLISSTFSVLAKSDEQQLIEWTKENENKLLTDYQTVESTWFEETCLELAMSMRFDQLNQCKAFKSNHINAYVFNNGHVYFSTAMMGLINNKHQWAAILAHENAHIELNHYLQTLKKINKPGFFFPKKKIKTLIRKNEQSADGWSELKLKEFGYKYNQIFYFFQRVKAIQGENRNKSHLKLSKRIKKVNQPEIIDNVFISQLQQLHQ